MLIEVKAKVSWIIDEKVRKRTETYLIDREFFTNAELKIIELLQDYCNHSEAEEYELLSLKKSQIKEVCLQYEGEQSYIVTLKDIFIDDDGNEKSLKYKVLLWANNITEAIANALNLVSQGYNMQVENIKEANYHYLTDEENETNED